MQDLRALPAADGWHEMYFTFGWHGLGQSALGDLGVDGRGDAAPQRVAVTEPRFDAGVKSFEIIDDLSDRRAGDLEALLAMGQVAEQRRYPNGYHAIILWPVPMTTVL
jgi:hypothetical protein